MCVCVCMDFTLSLGDIVVFCSPLCGVVCVIEAPHIDNGPCCRVVVAITSIIFTAQLCWGGFPLNVVPYVGEIWNWVILRMHTAVTVLSTYSTCSCVPPQGENSWAIARCIYIIYIKGIQCVLLYRLGIYIVLSISTNKITGPIYYNYATYVHVYR